MPGGPLPETGRAAAEPGGLTVRTVPIADPGDLLAGLPDTPVLSWVRQGRGLAGWGEVARITLSAGEDRFTAGEKRLRTLFEGVTCEDEVRVPGTGPVAFGSFTFDPA
jgi:menaquinone-specific isochorismate synthase